MERKEEGLEHSSCNVQKGEEAIKIILLCDLAAQSIKQRTNVLFLLQQCKAIVHLSIRRHTTWKLLNRMRYTHTQSSFLMAWRVFFPQAFCLIIKWYPCARDGFLRLPRQVCVVGSHSRTIIYSFYHSQKYTQPYSFDHTSQEHIWAKKRNYHQTVNEIQQRQAYLWECSGRAVSLLRQSPCRSSGRSLVCTGVWGAGLPYSPEE